MKERLEQLVARLTERDLEAILISAPENRQYFSGFTGSAGYLFVAKGKSILLTDSRYTEQAAHQAPDFQVIQVRGAWDWLLDLLKENRVHRLGFESQDMTVATYERVIDAIKGDPSLGKISLINASGLAEDQRVTKDKSELSSLQRAIDASDRAMQTVCQTIQEGMTEREVAWRMEMAMKDFGADGISFDTIVAAGPNGAMAHHMPSDYVIAKGEPIVIDMGARVDGYCSDITRSVVLGDPDETFRKVYDIVLGAQLTAINTVRPGMSGGDCDELSRSVIAEAGYGDNFGHSLGHGVGLAVHEHPRVGPGSTDRLESDMVFTVEPGIYITDWGGIRIEDIVVLGEDGATQLSRASK